MSVSFESISAGISKLLLAVCCPSPNPDPRQARPPV